LLAIDPQVGSISGSKIHVTGSGFGLEANVGLLASGVALCESVEVYEYGKFWCYTNAMEVAMGAHIKISIDGVANSDSFIAGDVVYAQ
jgi:hypothetical protein